MFVCKEKAEMKNTAMDIKNPFALECTFLNEFKLCMVQIEEFCKVK